MFECWNGGLEGLGGLGGLEGLESLEFGVWSLELRVESFILSTTNY